MMRTAPRHARHTHMCASGQAPTRPTLPPGSSVQQLVEYLAMNLRWAKGVRRSQIRQLLSVLLVATMFCRARERMDGPREWSPHARASAK